MRTIKFTVLTFFLLVSAGCGYTSSSLLPPELDSVHVVNFENKIDPAREVSSRRPTYAYWPGLEIDVTRATIDRFIFDRHLDIKSRKKAALLLKGQLVDFRQLPLSYDKGDSVTELRVEIFVDLELYNNLTGELMWREGRFMGWSSYDIAGPNAEPESGGVRSAVKDLSQRIVERVVEAW
ncbi:MAG: LPS assembly lipoprotein LptE [Candidatus Omnitrophota bacterium]|nr:LPS assembly lipoprotein LptE [Candidatus Omnitrophota bacterium]